MRLIVALIDMLADAQHEALCELFRHPSPDGGAFATKAEAYAANETHAFHEAAEFARILADEAKRFTT